MPVALKTWQDVKTEVLSRIQTRQWPQGSLIPTESDLATEFGCARTTVNRALRSIAEDGLLDRRRKAGTRVIANPVRKATVEIPVIRLEVEGRGQAYGYALLDREVRPPPAHITAQMRLAADTRLLHLKALHLCDGKPYAFEDRWINTAPLPSAMDVDFGVLNANEWLVQNAPFTSGDFAFAAALASREEAEALATEAGAALFIVERSTWNNTTAITNVRISYAPGHRMQLTV